MYAAAEAPPSINQSLGQWRRQAWSTGTRMPPGVCHANFAAVQTMAVLVFLPSSVSSKLDRQSHQLLWQAVAKKLHPYSFLQT